MLSSIILIAMIITNLTSLNIISENVNFVDDTHFNSKDTFSFTKILTPGTYFFVVDTTGLLGSRGSGSTYSITITFINNQDTPMESKLYIDGGVGDRDRSESRIEVPNEFNKINLSFGSNDLPVSGALFNANQLGNLDTAEIYLKYRRMSFIIGLFFTFYLIFIVYKKQHLKDYRKPFT